MQPPNVLVVMTDQQRFDTIAALGNDVIHTPHLDRLVAEGTAFTAAYTPSPECLPARYSLMSGRLPSTTGVWMNWASPDGHDAARAACGPWFPELLRDRGYRTFGIGKFHTLGWGAPLGFDVDLRSEEHWSTAEDRARDAYASFVAQYPAYAHVEQLMGERTEMYYVPQMSPLPAELNQEAWAAARAVEQIQVDDDRPFLGVVSFIGPHPPLAPPVPFNRMYDPDAMPARRLGDLAVDHLDDYLPWSNHAVYAEDVSDGLHRIITARYYGEITFIDQCLGQILRALDARAGGRETLLVFTADHGDHLGDHHAWQKQSFFEASARVPMLVRWPDVVPAGARCAALVGLTDVFATVASAAGADEQRDGLDLVGLARGEIAPRDDILSLYGIPGSPLFKLMVRRDSWKYVFLANGGRELLFDVAADPDERAPVDRPDVVAELRTRAAAHLRERTVDAALDGGDLRAHEFAPMQRMRIKQFDESRGITDFTPPPALLAL